MDLLTDYKSMPRSLRFFAESDHLTHLLDDIRTPKQTAFGKRFNKLNQELCSLVEDQGKSNFTPLDIQDKESVAYLVMKIDNANGFYYNHGVQDIPKVASYHV